MRVTAFVALAILAHGALGLPVQSSSPFEKDSRDIQKHQIEDLSPISAFVTPGGIIESAPQYPVETTSTGLPFSSHPDDLETFPTIADDIPGDGQKNQTNTIVSAQPSSRPSSHSAKGGYNYTHIEVLLSDLLSQYDKHESKHSKRFDPRLDNVGKGRNHFKVLNSTIPSDDEKARLIFDQLDSDLKKSRISSYRYNLPQLELAAIHKAEGRLRSLNVTKDASLRLGEKLRDYCYKVHGSRYRQESCARDANKMLTGTVLHTRPSWNSTALVGKRAMTEGVSDKFAASQAEQAASPSLSRELASVLASQLTLAKCPGKPQWRPVKHYEDVSDCALKTYKGNPTSNLERRDDDPTPDPAWLNKFLFPEQDNSLPKRNEQRWEFEGFGDLEYENPQTREKTEFDFEADWFSEWMQSHAGKDKDEHGSIPHTNSSTKHSARWDRDEQVRKLEHEIETKIANPFAVFKNATKDATEAIHDAVERFTARVHKHKSHLPGKMNVTATFDPSRHRKRGLPESVRKLENQIGNKITQPYDKLTEPFTDLKNSTKGEVDVIESLFEEMFKDNGFLKYLQEDFKDTLDNSTRQDFALKGKLPHKVYEDEDSQASGPSNSTQCSPSNSYNTALSSTTPRVHAREIRRSDGDPGNCYHNSEKTPNEEFSKANADYWFNQGTNVGPKNRDKKKALPADPEHITKEEEKQMIAEMIAELREELKDPDYKWHIPKDKAVH